MTPKKHGFDMRILWVIVIVAAVLVASKYSGHGLFSSVSISEFGACKVVAPQYYTLGCSPVGNQVPFLYNGSSSGTSIKVDTAVGSFVETARASADGVGAYRLVNSAGQIICQGDKTTNGCDGKGLISGETYSFKEDCGIFGCFGNHATITIRGQQLFLDLGVGTTGFRATLPGTANCIAQSINDNIKQTTLAGAIAAIGSKPGDNPQSVTLRQGQYESNFYGWISVTNTLAPYNYNGNAAICDIANKKIVGYTKQTAVDGTCVAVQDSSNVLFDGSSQKFCCNANDCRNIYGMSSYSACQSNVCVEGTQSNPQQSTGPTANSCVSNDQCGPSQYVTNSDGTNYHVTNVCTAGSCSQTRQQIACNPLQNYANNLCCGTDSSGNWKLGACTSSLTTCDTLGSDACCTDAQTKYTIKAPPAGKFCCDKNNDGVGFVTSSSATCADEGGQGNTGLFGLGNLFGGLSDLFNGIGSGLSAIFWAIVILAVLYIGVRISGRK